MKLLRCLPAFFLTVSLCVFGSMCGDVWAAGSPSSARTLRQAQSSGAATAASPEQARQRAQEQALIPGPLRSFLRMAAISQQVSPDEVLPLLARNIVVSGYQGNKPTQFLILINWYIDQARELEALAGPQGAIRVSSCEDAKPLLVILGYRLRQPCGPDAAVETSNADRAFLTIDSGFPLAQLEETLRGGKPFDLLYSSTSVPVLYHADDWVLNEKNANKGVVDSLLRNPGLARLYWGLSRMDGETGAYLWKSLGPKKLVPSAAALDFYGSHISVRSGHVLVPGGRESESAWKDLVGASPAAPSDFVTHLLTKDEGWAAAYFDALSRVGRTQQAYFANPSHLQVFYTALRGDNISPSPTKHSFRPDQGLFLLVTRLQLDPNGRPHIPGNVDVWKDILRAKTDSKIIHDWSRKSGSWNNPEQVMEGMFGLSRVISPQGPMHNYLMLNEIDRGRTPEQRLSVQTIHLLADKYERFGDQYTLFAEFHQLNDLSITRYLAMADYLSSIPDRLERADALGMFQANIGLFQILVRQGQIPEASMNDSWQHVVNAFGGARSSVQIFEAGRIAFSALMTAATGRPVVSQDQALALLAGPEQATREGQQLRVDMANRMRQVLEDQRLVSLDTLLTLGDGLTRMSKGEPASDSLLSLASELREFEMPKPLFTNSERTELVAGLYSNRHTTLQMRTDLAKVIKGPGTPAELLEARGSLTPFLRDTLVGLNYAYYEPPGAQMLHSNPLFVRSHDFSGGDYSGEIATAGEQTWRSPRLFGRGWTASGGAHLIGSLADLPYVLAKVEQDFIVPQNVQSLIWEDFVPGLMTSAVLPRWWGVTHNELHAVALYQRTGEELLASAAKDEKLRANVVDILSDRMLPQRSEQIDLALRAGEAEDALTYVAPAEGFYLTAEFRRRFPKEKGNWGVAGKELDDLIASNPAETSWDRLSADFGVPHRALAQNYARELLNVKPFPTFLDYSSRLLAESWDSNNLYWARLADELGYSPVMMNRIVPALTRRMVEQTFASNLEDWPAVLRAMRETGEEFREGKIAALSRNSPSAGL
jgi:hypothetical protein